MSALNNTSSWVPGADDHPDWTIHNLPFGIFSTEGAGAGSGFSGKRAGVAIGDMVLDLASAAETGLLEGVGGRDGAYWAALFRQDTLNGFMALTRPSWRAIRGKCGELLGASASDAMQASVRSCLVPAAGVTMHLPANIGDYTDFYSSREHATNVGTMFVHGNDTFHLFRDPANALQPNWLHLPVGYHGRSSSVVVSGTDLRRPCGQLQADMQDEKKGSVYGPCRLMDFELEMAFFVGGPSTSLGEPIDMADAEDHIFGMVLMNDWSARDIQRWEYVPLGPFGSKNFGTSISPWIVTLDALEPFRCATSAGAQTEPVPLPYLRDPAYSSYDVDLEVTISPAALASGATAAAAAEPAAPAFTVCRSNFRHLYWTIKQQLVHHTVTGCNVRAGDLMGSGTISGEGTGRLGSMLELSWKGTREVVLREGEAADRIVRKFLADGDAVTMTGSCGGKGGATGRPAGQPRLGFGSVTGRVLPAKPFVPK